MGHTDMPRAAEVRPVESLAELAALANKSVEDGAQNLRVAGESLLKAKGIVGHGGWSDWLAKNWRHSPEYARRLIRAAKRPTVDGVLDAVSESTPDEQPYNSKRNSSSVLTTDEIGQSDEPEPTYVETPPQSRSPWKAPVVSGNDRERMREQAELKEIKQEIEDKHLPLPPAPAVIAERKLTGTARTAFVGQLIKEAEGVRDDLIALRVHYGPDSPDWTDTCVLIEKLLRLQKDCWRLESERGN